MARTQKVSGLKTLPLALPQVNLLLGLLRKTNDPERSRMGRFSFSIIASHQVEETFVASLQVEGNMPGM